MGAMTFSVAQTSAKAGVGERYLPKRVRFAAKIETPNEVSPHDFQDSRPEAPYWSLLPKSPLVGKVDPLDFTASDLDLAGKLRLKDGNIDPGCYQCWLNPAGFMMIVR